MNPDIFTTVSLPPRDQHDAWRERFRPILDVMPRHAGPPGFAAENQVWTLGTMAVSRVSAPPVRVVRTKAGLRRNPVDHWVLTYCRRGATVISTSHAVLQAPPGVPFLWSLGEESESERSQVDRVQFFMPRDAFRDIAPLLDATRGSALDTPLGHLLGDYMLALERRLPSLTRDDVPPLTAAVRAMVAAAVAPSAERVAIASRQLDFGRMERVRGLVRKHLRSPALTPAALCRLVGMSRSHLYRILEEAGGVARYIQRQRLLEAQSLLCSPGRAAAVSAIAEDLCFPDASVFSRAFRREFGLSPSEMRAAALSGLPPADIAQARATPELAGFGDLLRGF